MRSFAFVLILFPSRLLRPGRAQSQCNSRSMAASTPIIRLALPEFVSLGRRIVPQPLAFLQNCSRSRFRIGDQSAFCSSSMEVGRVTPDTEVSFSCVVLLCAPQSYVIAKIRGGFGLSDGAHGV